MFKMRRHQMFWILVAALAVSRFIGLGYAPLRYDESHQLIRAVDCVQKIEAGAPGWLSCSFSRPSNIFHVAAVMIFGESEFAARLPVVVQSLVIAVFVFLIGRRFFGKKAGRIALLISLVLPFNFAYGRYAQYDIGQVFYFIIGVYLLFLWLYEKCTVGRWLSPLFFALAFLSKYNALIPQGIILTSYALCDVRDWRRYIASAENLFLTGVFTLVLSLHQFPEFLSNLFGWVAVVVGIGGAESGSSSGVIDAILTSAKFHYTAFTFLWFLAIGYGFVCFKKMNERDRLLLLSTGLYFLAVTFQGRLQMRYLNLESFLVVLLLVVLGTKFMQGRSQKIIGIIFVCAALAQCGVQYFNYYCYEKHTVPYWEIHKTLEALDDTAPAIYLPKNFPLNYAGICQLNMMIAKDGVLDHDKTSVYHFSHMPFPYEEQEQRDPSSRVRMQRTIKESFPLFVHFKFSKLNDLWVDFVRSEKHKTKPVSVSLDQFFEDASIPVEAVYVQAVQGAGMYPVLDKRIDPSERVDIPRRNDVWKSFNIVGTDCPAIVMYIKSSNRK